VSRASVVAFGSVCGLGLGVNALWAGVQEGRTAIRRVTRFPVEGLCSEVAAEVPLQWSDNRASHLLLAAATELQATPWMSPPERRAVVIGTTKGAFEEPSEREDPLGAPARALARAFDVRGPVLGVSAACASSLAAIGEGLSLLEEGGVDEVLVGGTEALHAFVYHGFHALKALSPSPAIPFDEKRAGLSLGEGAGVLWLRRPGMSTQSLGEIAGYGAASDAWDQTAPEPKGAGLERALKKALKSAQLLPSQVQRYHAHGTATPHNDAMESLVLSRMFGPKRIPVSATKGSLGHTLGAAGVLDVILALKGLSEGVLPRGAQGASLDERLAVDLVRSPREARHDVGIVASAGFGGLNAALVIARSTR
jgi:3-oxoacyl-[acyl-carrier-protein] synthase II